MQRLKQSPFYLWLQRRGYNRVLDVFTASTEPSGSNDKGDTHVLADFSESSNSNVNNCSISQEQTSPANDRGTSESVPSRMKRDPSCRLTSGSFLSKFQRVSSPGVIGTLKPEQFFKVRPGDELLFIPNPYCIRNKQAGPLIVLFVAFRLIGILLIFVDLFLLIIELFATGIRVHAPSKFCSISLVIAVFLFMDVLFRLNVEGSQLYFSDKLSIIDTTIVVVTLVAAIAYKVYELEFVSLYPSFAVLFQSLRLIIITRIFQLVYQKRNLEMMARRLVAGNKRRYTNQEFDLDLTYVTGRIIAMSFPSSGRQSFYRNPIKEVVRFLDTTHPNHYRVYNLCSEKSYDPKLFHNRVQRIMIDDHNVPSLKEMLLFSQEVCEWMAQDDDNVVVIHCKGGKGRTGTMVCACLIFNKIVLNAKESLYVFGDRRTDLSNSSKYQGIETPSQHRYVNYFEHLALFYQWTLPPRKVLAIKKFIIYSIHGVGRGNGSDLEVQIMCQKAVFSCSSFKNCMIFHDIEANCVIINLYKCPALYDDVKVKFLCPLVPTKMTIARTAWEEESRFKSAGQGLPKYYDNCPFFFWFHTSFIENNRLYLARNELDNPHKLKTWKIYNEEFAVEMCFVETRLFVH